MKPEDLIKSTKKLAKTKCRQKLLSLNGGQNTKEEFAPYLHYIKLVHVYLKTKSSALGMSRDRNSHIFVTFGKLP